MKASNHAVWPERAHAELGNGPLLPWPPDTAAQHWHCSFLSLHSWEQLREEGPCCDCPEKAPSVLSGTHQCRTTNTWLGSCCSAANREMAPRMAPKPKGREQALFGSWSLQQAGQCRAKEGREHAAETNLPSPRSLQLHQLFLAACFPPFPLVRAGQGSCCRRHSSSLSAYPEPAVPAPWQEG